ncbi:MAG: hypothetical protein P8Y70_09980 [Candidatus Lokiarchaeota archaeon]
MYEWKVKILLLGDKLSGKEDFCSKFTLGFSHQFKEYMGVDIFVKNLVINENETISLSFWNLTRNQYLKFLLPNFIKGAEFAMIWFNVMKKKSFDEAKFWVKLVRKELDDLPIILLGNIEDFTLRKEIERNEIRTLLNTINIQIYIETSINNNLNIQETLEILGEILANSKKLNKPLIDFQNINTNVKQKIEKLTKLYNLI